MAEGTYEHACMRAELLGLEKPNEEEFLRHQPKPNIDESLIAAQFEVSTYIFNRFYLACFDINLLKEKF